MMPIGFFVRFGICLIMISATFYAIIEQNNTLTVARLTIPQRERAVKSLWEENERLKYQIELFESPSNLLQQLRQPEFRHLKYPKDPDVWIIEPSG